MNRSSLDRESKAIRERHPQFFDLEFVRKSNVAARDLSDEQIWENLLDTQNPTPFQPNVIFDVSFYTKENKERFSLGVQNPILHYLFEGEASGFNPNPYFELAFYGVNIGGHPAPYPSLVEHALAHFDGSLAPFHPFIDAAFCYQETGARDLKSFYEGLFQDHLNPLYPHPLFDGPYFMGHLQMRLQDAFDFYWAAEEDLSTHPLFDPEYYRAQQDGGENIGHSVYHYLITASPASPHPLFDNQVYSNQLFQLQNFSVERPFEHYLAFGIHLGLDPSAYFDTAFYREQSGSGPDALRHYVTDGHEKFSPHPVIDLPKARLFQRAIGREKDGGSVGVEWYKTLPLQATPDFDPVFVSKKQKQSKNPIELRCDYLKDGYPNGEKPNGLLSLNYISTQIPEFASRPNLAIRAYFQRGFQNRKRVLFAFQSLEDTPSMQAWLALLQSQISNADLELIVVAQCEGSLTAAFSKVAHIWHFGADPTQDQTFSRLMQSGLRLAEVMRSNQPVACLVQTSPSLDFAKVFSHLNYPVTGIVDSNLSPKSADELAVLKAFPNGLIAPSGRVRASFVAQGISEDAIKIGFNNQVLPVISAEVQRSTRIKTRANLGVQDDEVLIVSTGDLDLEGGVDIFGAALAQLVQLKDAPDKIKFLWHGKGPTHPNTPVFYARHFLRSVGVEAKFILVQEGPLEDYLSAADIYLEINHSEHNSRGLALAKALRLAIVRINGPCEPETEDDSLGVTSIDEFNLEAAARALANLAGDSKLRADCGTKIYTAAAADLTTERLVERARTMLQSLYPSLPLLIGFQPISTERVLVFMGSPKSTLLENAATNSHVDDLEHKLRNLMVLDSSAQITIVSDTNEISDSFVSKFGRSLCYFSGTLNEVQTIYRIGLHFDEIFVENQQAIEEVRKMNSLISQKMKTV